MVTVNDQLSIRLSTLITIENYKQIQFVRANSHVLKRLVSTVRFCPSAPYNRYSRNSQYKRVRAALTCSRTSRLPSRLQVVSAARQ
jgi:hypothetical protein